MVVLIIIIIFNTLLGGHSMIPKSGFIISCLSLILLSLLAYQILNRQSWEKLAYREKSTGSLASYFLSNGPQDANVAAPETMILSNHELNIVKKRAEGLANLIHKRFELDSLEGWQLFMIMWNLPIRGWDILKYKFALKLLAGLGRRGLGTKFRNAGNLAGSAGNGTSWGDNAYFSREASTFRMVFGGSSVTAGYDNLLNQSYPMVIARRLAPLLEAAGVRIDVRNVGQLHVDCRLSNYCLETQGIGELVSPSPALSSRRLPQLDIESNGGYERQSEVAEGGVDVVGWENSFDCAKSRDSLEFVARLAASRGALVHYSASGGFSVTGCKASSVSSIHCI